MVLQIKGASRINKSISSLTTTTHKNIAMTTALVSRHNVFRGRPFPQLLRYLLTDSDEHPIVLPPIPKLALAACADP